ncbi:MAG: FimB/Mfa2 family fimbrial subunit [Tannerella sp.]|jgi:hypothetical protein|nr:FimB/Mfa2 family fimbrial subunit [Tannerella sp.]
MSDCNPVPAPSVDDTVGKVRVFFDYMEATETSSADMGIRKGIRRGDLESVSQVDLYIFDSTGVFIDKYTDMQPLLRQKDTYCMEIELSAGKYTFVAWGGLQKTDFAVTPASPAKKLSRFNDFTVNYRFEGDTIILPVENLYYGIIENTSIRISDSLRIHLRQDTYTFNIKLAGSAVRQGSGIGVNDSEIFEMLITDNNSCYDFTNKPVSAPTHIYKTGFNPTPDRTIWNASRTTLLVDNDRKPVLRFFRNGRVWKLRGMNEGIDLVKLIKQYTAEKYTAESGDPLDFTTMYEFYLTFNIEGDPDDESSLSVEIEIGNWKLSSSDNELFM